MATTPYRPTSWSDTEPAHTAKLNQMSQNDQWLFENTPRMRYSAHGIQREQGLKIAAGIKMIVADQNNQHIVTVDFGSFFSSACYPVVVVGGTINRQTVRCHTGARALSGLQIDNRGFEIIAAADNAPYSDYMTSNYYVPWIAMGF